MSLRGGRAALLLVAGWTAVTRAQRIPIASLEQVDFFVLDNKLKGGCIAADPATRGDHDTLLNLRDEHECKIRCAWQRSCVAYEFATLTNTFTRCALHRSPVDVGFPSQDSVSSVCYLKRLDGWTGQPEWMQRITIADATPPPFPPPPPPVDPCENIIFSPSAAEIAATPCLELVKPGAHLLDCKMNNADLRGADLTGGTIDHGELAGAQLQCAKLQGVYVTATSFEKANLSYSILDGAQFESNPVLKYASFRSASLEGTKFGAALLSGADFSRSNMHTAVLAYSEALDPVIFTDANLTGLVILDSVMPNSNFKGATLNKALVLKADLMRSIFDETTSFEGVDFSEADLSYAELQGANLEGVRVKNSQFNYANLARSSFRHARLETVDFSHARAHFSDFSHASLKGCFLAGSFVESVFYDADLLATTFISGGAVAALQRADFTGAKNVAPDAFDGIPPDLLRDVAGIPPPPPP